MIKFAVPVIYISNSAAAEEFYCGRLGLRREFAHRGDEANADPCYMGVSRDGVWGAVVNLFVDDVDALHAELVGKGVRIDTEPVDQTWRSSGMHVRDTDANCVRFIQQGVRRV